MPIKVLLVEDSAVLVDRIVDLFAERPEVEISTVAHTEAAAATALQRQDFDVMILDLQLREGSGLDLLHAVAKMKLKARTIILTNHDLPEYQRVAAALGATAFLDKARDFERLPEILEEIAAGEARQRYLDRI